MKSRSRAPLLIVALAVALTACGSPSRTGEPTPTTTTPRRPSPTVISDGAVCGVTALGGGPFSASAVKYPALLHGCPSGAPAAGIRFSLVVANGKRYKPTNYEGDGWMARIPPGTYRAVDVLGCPDRFSERSFAVTSGKTTLGVVVWYGCTYR
jgi:hypothetical protein